MFLIQTRQIDLEDRAFRGLAVYQNESLILLYDSVHRGQSQAGAFARWLRRIERFEYVRQILGGNSAAVIADSNQSVMSFRDDSRLAVDIVVIKSHVGRRCAQMPTLRHGIASVRSQIH